MCEGRTTLVVYLLLALIGVGVGCGCSAGDSGKDREVDRRTAEAAPGPNREVPDRFVVVLPCSDRTAECGPVFTSGNAPGRKLLGDEARHLLWEGEEDRLIEVKVRIEGAQRDLLKYSTSQKRDLRDRIYGCLSTARRFTSDGGSDSAEILDVAERETMRGRGLDDPQTRRRVLAHLQTIERGIDEALATIRAEIGPDATPDGGK